MDLKKLKKIDYEIEKNRIYNEIFELRKFDYYDKALQMINKKYENFTFWQKIKKNIKKSKFAEIVELRNKMINDEYKEYLKYKKTKKI